MLQWEIVAAMQCWQSDGVAIWKLNMVWEVSWGHHDGQGIGLDEVTSATSVSYG